MLIATALFWSRETDFSRASANRMKVLACDAACFDPRSHAGKGCVQAAAVPGWIGLYMNLYAPARWLRRLGGHWGLHDAQRRYSLKSKGLVNPLDQLRNKILDLQRSHWIDFQMKHRWRRFTVRGGVWRAFADFCRDRVSRKSGTRDRRPFREQLGHNCAATAQSFSGNRRNEATHGNSTGSAYRVPRCSRTLAVMRDESHR